MAPVKLASLEEVGKLFNDLLATIRDDLDHGALEPVAIAWLKEARYKLMRDLETKYYELATTRHTPLLLPLWVNPAHSLFLHTEFVPAMLSAYQHAFVHNIRTLMKDCGFQSCRVSSSLSIDVVIQFPRWQNVASNTIPASLYVDDQFSRMAEGATRGDQQPGGFSVVNFARLVEDTRLDANEGPDTAEPNEAGLADAGKSAETKEKIVVDQPPEEAGDSIAVKEESQLPLGPWGNPPVESKGEKKDEDTANEDGVNPQ
ncbi:hypothetical protein B0H11DRAFT_1031315 [Mycena galericulata]|nr:hypothetical protein B0H11DRAFT_1031315 [Mycena galericulata]